MTAVWRISWNGALDLQTLPNGSLLADGRWHVAANRLPVVYAGSTRALCQLEKRVHCNGYSPANLALIRLDLPGAATFLSAEDLGLKSTWRSDETHTQALGSAWAATTDSLGLWVPSYVEPAERNLIVNPRHPLYVRIQLEVELNPFEFDPRLFP